MNGDIMETVRAELLANAIILSTVVDATYASGRIFVTYAPPDAAQPYMVLTLVSDVPYNVLNTTSRTDRLSAQRLQVDCYARTYEASRTLANAADDALGGLARTAIVAERDNLEASYEADTKLHRIRADYLVHLHG